MNADDPRLTAYALGELSGTDKAEIEKLIADSPEARDLVNETQDFAEILKSEYAADDAKETARPANLIDIRDDPWFWSRARPLAIAATIAVFAIIGAIIFGPRNLRNAWIAKSTHQSDVVNLENVEDGPPGILEMEMVPNPLGLDRISRVEQVVVGELPVEADPARSEIQIIEVINDSDRISKLKNCLASRTMLRTTEAKSNAHGYQLILIDRAGDVVAAASFRVAPGDGYVLQLYKRAYAAGGHYFIGNDTPVIPADWKTDLNYSEYVLPFPDGNQFIGYAPGA